MCPLWGQGRVPAQPGAFKVDLARFRARLQDGENGAPGETQRSGFAGERRSSGMSEFSPLWGGNEGYGAYDEEEQDKGKASSATPLAGHNCPQCGQFQEFLWALEMGSKSESKQSFAVVIPQCLLPQGKNRGQAPERRPL